MDGPSGGGADELVLRLRKGHPELVQTASDARSKIETTLIDFDYAVKRNLLGVVKEYTKTVTLV